MLIAAESLMAYRRGEDNEIAMAGALIEAEFMLRVISFLGWKK